jgi:tetratricopeptide (TPR) repeat protein
MSAKDQSVYFNHKATFAQKDNKYEKTVEYYKKSLEKDPTNGEALINFAMYSVDRESYVMAEILYSRAEAIPTKAKQALLGKAQLYLDKQDHQSALSVLQNTYSRFPNLHYLTEQINIIKSIIRTKNKTAI